MDKEVKRGHGFNTAPVFLAGISTILGAILFLRFGYAVGNVGLVGGLMIILIGHAITIPTGLAIAEISTNLKVKGGGEYYMISRSFGINLGSAIGVALWLSQTISVAFYIIAFSEAFTPLFPFIEKHLGFTPDIRMISIPALLLLIYLLIKKGANIGVKVLWFVAAILGLSLMAFFFGEGPGNGYGGLNLLGRIEDPDDFFMVFAICFPAFTGMTAGVGFSGDLKNPARSIPLGTLSATLVGMVVYVAVVFKLHLNVPPEALAGDQLIMSQIAIWGPAIPIGLAAATLSSAIGSYLIAPRTLQALAVDKIFPSKRINRKISLGKGKKNEPYNAMLIVSVIALVFVSLGSVNFVAQIISMFFMTTYGSLCLISFFEHFSGNPSYRPVFRSKWYLSLIGAIMCFFMMFQMQPVYAILALLFMYLIYRGVRRTNKGTLDLSYIFQNVLFQLTRRLRIYMQKSNRAILPANWRPSVIGITNHTHERLGMMDFLRWISHLHGFGTYFHYINGKLNSETIGVSETVKNELVELANSSGSSVFVNTVVSPSLTSAVAQIIQISGVSGMENNTIVFEFYKGKQDELKEILHGISLARIVNHNILVLRSSEYNFGYRRRIDVWLTGKDYNNANLKILLAYILKGHRDWKRAEIKVIMAFPEEELAPELESISHLVSEGRFPISAANITPIAIKDENISDLMGKVSGNADLVITGFDDEQLDNSPEEFFMGFQGVKDILFVNSRQEISIL